MSIMLQLEIETLREQYRLVTEEIHAWARIVDASMGLGLAVIGGAAAYGIKEERVLAGIPFILGIVVLYGLQARAAIEAIAGHKMALEERVNTLLGGKRVLCWEETAKNLIVEKTPQKVFNAAVIFLFACSCVTATIIAWRNWHLWGTVAIIETLLGLAAAMEYSRVAGNDRREKAWDAARLGESPLAIVPGNALQAVAGPS